MITEVQDCGCVYITRFVQTIETNTTKVTMDCKPCEFHSTVSWAIMHDTQIRLDEWVKSLPKVFTISDPPMVLHRRD